MKKTAVLVASVCLWANLSAQDTKEYKNYDFVAGDKILLEDNFATDKVGAAPANWKLEGGKAVVMQKGDEKFVSVLEYYTKFSPKLKTNNYLSDVYTIEFDCWLDAGYDGNSGIELQFMDAANEPLSNITPNRDYFSIRYPENGEANGETPEAIRFDKFYNRWNHVAIIYKKKQIKVYANQFLVFEVADCKFKASSIMITGNTSGDMPIYFKNFKLALGGDMSDINKALTKGKFVTSGIKFDVNKATIKPESMGVLNQVAAYMKENPTAKFEIGGYTDSDGDDASNLKLSQARAEAVKNQLVSMGAKAENFTTQGYGESNPVDKNTTIEGKANNRRVEFVKK